MTVEDAIMFAAIVGFALMVIAWSAERYARHQAQTRAWIADDRAETALDRLAEERRLHPKRAKNGRFAKRATFGG